MIVIIFLISLIASYFLVSRISRPLKRLAAYAKEIPLQDFTDHDAGRIDRHQGQKDQEQVPDRPQ